MAGKNEAKNRFRLELLQTLQRTQKTAPAYIQRGTIRTLLVLAASDIRR